MIKLNPYLNFPGTAEEALSLYRSAFGGEFSSVVRFKDMPMEGLTIPPEAADKIMHMALPVGDETLMASDALESLGQKLVAGNNSYVSVHVDSRAEADRIFGILSAGGAVEMAMADQPWGDYYGSFKDRFGIQWMVMHTPPKKA